MYESKYGKINLSSNPNTDPFRVSNQFKGRFFRSPPGKTKVCEKRIRKIGNSQNFKLQKNGGYFGSRPSIFNGYSFFKGIQRQYDATCQKKFTSGVGKN